MRTDVHRPSVIVPEDYQFVAFSYLKIEDLGTALFLQDERKRLAAHMDMTGAKYSGHEHGGNCHVCGNANAIYTACFYHGPTNSYIKTGLDCAEKLECYGVDEFKSKVRNALDAKAGKNKAKAVLELEGVGAAWEIYQTGGASKEAEIVVDMVDRLVKWGDISEKALKYLRVLLDRIARAPEIAAQRAAENEAAKPIPEFKGRATVKGEVLTIKLPGEFDPYPAKKMLVRHADGWKLWGTVPASIVEDLKRGDVIEFAATVKVSDKDPKFGFISRPAKARIVTTKEAA